MKSDKVYWEADLFMTACLSNFPTFCDAASLQTKPAESRVKSAAPEKYTRAWPLSFPKTSAAAYEQAHYDQRQADDKPPQLAGHDTQQEDDDAGQRYVKPA
jgi:hypothetical protein